MSPSEAAQEGWNKFKAMIAGMSDEDYATACEELASTCESSAELLRSEMEEPE